MDFLRNIDLKGGITFPDGSFYSTKELAFLIQELDVLDTITEDEKEILIGMRNETEPKSRLKSSLDTKKWMGKLGDRELLSELSIPGTHNTMSGNKHKDNDCTYFLYKRCCVCQDTTLKQQLHAGIRFFDIRLKHHDNDFTLHHGFISLGVKLNFVLNYLIGFLKKNPTETVIFSYMKEHTEENNKGVPFHVDFQKQIKKINRKYIYSGNSMPSLGDVRGKIVLLDWHRNGRTGLSKNNNLVENWWDDIMYWSWFAWYVKDEYYNKLENNIKSSQSKTQESFYLSWFSANDCKKTAMYYSPRKIAKKVNHEMHQRLRKRQTRGNYGIIVMDFPSDHLIQTVIKENMY